MKEEMNSLQKNKIWILTKLPKGKKSLQNKWVYRVKEEHDGKKRYKARLVVKGFQQKEGIDYTEIFSHVVKLTTIRLVLSIVAAENLHLEQLDVKTAFLHGDLEEDIHMKKPEGFQVFGSSINEINLVKQQLAYEFEIKDLGPAKQMLGMRFSRNGSKGTLKLSKKKYIQKRLNIMIDVASAMDYLHNGYSTPVVHCDLKPNNVLLDQDMVCHVSDFGIAKLLGAGETFVQTRTIATIGYVAPEYGQDGIVSTSCNVYSFGILMMEAFTRMRPSDKIFTGDLSIRCWVSDSFPSEIHRVVDANLVRPVDEQTAPKMQCMLSIMELALSCTLVTPDARTGIEEAL
uniref:non-specific serine/threonine protein kinase n=1 Tax=Nicotiana tabacum TaxID=4097 RepID=A0A1S4DCQ0_TOBAC|nr:PREDICTED: putative receptor-like protein kinase At3g47110 [Nicotiana tabacum]